MPQELQDKIIKTHLQSTNQTASQADRLAWVCILGPTWMGFEAYKRLLEVVILYSNEKAIFYLQASTRLSLLANHFDAISNGESLNPLSFTKSLYFSFEIGQYHEDMPVSFDKPFACQLGRFCNLRIISFDISEFDSNRSFRAIGAFRGHPCPPLLQRVRLVSVNTKVTNFNIQTF